MNEFVDFGKRGIELPPGCKDLIDVLPPQREALVPAEGLSHVERYLSRLLPLTSGSRAVWINDFKLPATLGLIYGKRGLLALLFLAPGNEQSIRLVLNQAGLALMQDDAVGGAGPFTRFLLFSLPADAETAARIVHDLLRKGYGLPGDTQLHFSYHEKHVS